MPFMVFPSPHVRQLDYPVEILARLPKPGRYAP